MPVAAPAIEVPAQIDQNLVLVPVRIGSSPELTFILDTGAETTVVASDRIADAGLSGGVGSSGTAQGGEIETRLFRNVNIRVGSLDIGKSTVAAVDLAGLSAGVGRRIDGILGYDFFRDRVVRIDYSTRKIEMLPGGASPGRGFAVPIAIRGHSPFVDARVSQGRAAASGRFLVDTGALGAVNLYAGFLDLHPRLRPGKSLALTSGAILPGQFVTRMGRLTSLAIGPVRIRGPLASFSANPDSDDSAPGDAGLIGSSVLSRYVVTFDYPHRRMNLEPKRADSPIRFDASGLSLVAAGPRLEMKKVRLVLPGSPAAGAGVKAGDLLLAIDGRSAETLPLGAIRDMFRKVGVSYRLDLRRDGAPISVDVRTRQLI